MLVSKIVCHAHPKTLGNHSQFDLHVFFQMDGENRPTRICIHDIQFLRLVFVDRCEQIKYVINMT